MTEPSKNKMQHSGHQSNKHPSSSKKTVGHYKTTKYEENADALGAPTEADASEIGSGHKSIQTHYTCSYHAQSL